MLELIEVADFLHLTGTPAVSKGDDFLIECPWHTGKTKLRIDKNTGICNCFSCKAHGNLWTLSIKLTGKNLYDLLGISPEKRKSLSFVGTLNNVTRKEKEEVRIDDIIIKGQSLDIFSSSTPEYVKTSAKNLYLSKEYCDYYGVRYSLNMEVRGVNVAPEKATMYSNRFLWSIYYGDKLINIDGRTIIGEDPKVIYCKGGKLDTLFDINRLDPTKPLIVCEGIKDTIKLWHLGYRNITAILGASITEGQLRQLRMFKEIIYLTDNDRAGLEAADYLYENLNIEMKLGLPPEGKDPFKCSFEENKSLVENAIDYTDYDLSVIKDHCKNKANTLWFK